MGFMNNETTELYVTIFFCQRLDAEAEMNRRIIEKESDSRIKLFPLPCSGRIEPLHFMRAFEAGADMVYLVTCPENACRYREGNTRARKRLAFTRGLIQEIGLEPERLELVIADQGTPPRIDILARDLLSRMPPVGPSPLRVTHMNSNEGASL
jgi:F420-non-reducing hydrogenase iron-sulfur subunit